ncbi:MAG: hypothetical protein JNM74_04375, partial [Myxococcales bacterium]|nr:hypothetical protein [Myxococcales bacterium]
TTLRTPKRPNALTIFDLTTDTKNAGNIGEIGLVDGRYVQIDFDNARGGSWDYQHYPVHIGFDEEKILALREMVDSRPTLSTISRENALDGRDPYISFRTDNAAGLDRLIGGILAQDWETIAPSLSSDKRTLQTFSIVDRDPSKLVRPNGAKIVFPNTGYSNAIGMGIYSVLFSRFSSDLTLTNKLRIRFANDNGPQIPDARRVSFTDPQTGFRYDASRFGVERIQGRDVETGIASRMLQRANELVSAAYQVKEVDGAPVLDGFGQPELTLVNGAPVVKAPDQAAALRRYIGLLDGIRQVGLILGDGPLGN